MNILATILTGLSLTAPPAAPGTECWQATGNWVGGAAYENCRSSEENGDRDGINQRRADDHKK